MKRENINTVFDLLAVLCSCFSKEEERSCVKKWSLHESEMRSYIAKYSFYIDLVLNMADNEYIFSDSDLSKVNRLLNDIETDHISSSVLFMLTVQIANAIDVYQCWQMKGNIFRMEPLNSNYEECGISIYPHTDPKWDVSKSERNRQNTFNSMFKRYFIIRKSDESPFKMTMHYWSESNLLQETDFGWKMKIALSPVMDSVMLSSQEIAGEHGVVINGIENVEVVENRVLRIFEKVFLEGYNLIVFPEMLGTEGIIEKIIWKMRQHPEIATLVLLPTICREKMNSLNVLGPGGVKILCWNKSAEFVLIDENNIKKREILAQNNEIHVLLTEELGNIVFPICADFLEPEQYNLLRDVARADTIICPSFSPGVNAFKSTLIKGLASKILSIWINCCAAKQFSVCQDKFSNTLGMIQLPDASVDKNIITELQRKCKGICADTLCYFSVTLEYRNNRFYCEWKHCIAA